MRRYSFETMSLGLGTLRQINFLLFQCNISPYLHSFSLLFAHLDIRSSGSIIIQLYPIYAAVYLRKKFQIILAHGKKNHA